LDATKTNPAPLDAFDAAKPDEPIWTVQGGDPLGAHLLRVWAHFARIRAGVIPPLGIEYVYEHILAAAQNNRPDEKNACDDLLTRAALTEDISFNMDAYLRGQPAEIAEERKVTAMQKMDLWDTRRRFASRISNFFSEMDDYKNELQRHGYMFESLEFAIFQATEELRSIMRIVDVKRKKV
jgi:hypothetical protein